jgi:class 3 adenylate cyclase
MERRLAAILMADMVGYSRLMSTDEAGTLSALKTSGRNVLKPQLLVSELIVRDKANSAL